MQLIRDSIDLSRYMSEPAVEHKIDPASDWISVVIDHFYKPDDSPKIRPGWRNLAKDFVYRDAEVTLWAGINGHGKSQVVGQMMLDLLMQGEKVCLASLEMSPTRTMARMARQAWGGDQPGIDYLKQFGKFTDDKLWIYDHVGSSNPRTMLAVIRFVIDKFQVKHFVVDNLMKVIAGEDDYNAQKDFVNGLCTIAHDTGCHIHLVLHVKKGRNEQDQPGKFDIKGSGAITDLVDNVFIVWRNKGKEDSFRSGDMARIDEPDATLKLEKQRNGETEGSYFFWFDPQSFQYLESRHDQSKRYPVENRVSLEEIEI